ncbi:MAG: hypothetical protein KC442_04375, partial [Thermomicrobiales bacterium]|nr:hypothetical protein [Thermomicrobiales bacterium]
MTVEETIEAGAPPRRRTTRTRAAKSEAAEPVGAETAANPEASADLAVEAAAAPAAKPARAPRSRKPKVVSQDAPGAPDHEGAAVAASGPETSSDAV